MGLERRLSVDMVRSPQTEGNQGVIAFLCTIHRRVAGPAGGMQGED